MPSVDPASGSPYPTIETVMDIARARVNDQMNAVSGDDLADDAISSQTYLTAAWKWYQSALATAGVETWIRNTVLFAIPPRATNDPSNEAFITWEGCSDGVNQYPSPALPQDLILPLSFWQRRSTAIFGSNNGVPYVTISPNSGAFVLMTQAQDGLPPYIDASVYDWRDDGLYFYGTQNYAQDLKMRYSAYRQDLDITEPTTQIPMMMCEDAMGSRVAYEFTSARKGPADPVSVSLKAWADEAVATSIRRSSRRKQRQNIQRIGFAGGDSNYGAFWPIIGN